MTSLGERPGGFQFAGALVAFAGIGAIALPAAPAHAAAFLAETIAYRQAKIFKGKLP